MLILHQPNECRLQFIVLTDLLGTTSHTHSAAGGEIVRRILDPAITIKHDSWCKAIIVLLNLIRGNLCAKTPIVKELRTNIVVDVN